MADMTRNHREEFFLSIRREILDALSGSTTPVNLSELADRIAHDRSCTREDVVSVMDRLSVIVK